MNNSDALVTGDRGLVVGDQTAGVIRDSWEVATLDELRALVERLNSTTEPDPDLIGEIGAGELENLVRAHGEQLWPEIERIARSDIRFRRALASVWAYDSPEYERRTRLLEELGEARTVTISFVVEPEDFANPPLVSWRAVEVGGEPAGRQLGRLLREIADWYEREPLTDNPEVIKNRGLQRHYMEWAKAAFAVERIRHEVSVAPDGGALRAVVNKAHVSRGREQDAWAEFLGAVNAP